MSQLTSPKSKIFEKLLFFSSLLDLNHTHYKHHLFKQNKKTYLSGFFPLAPKYHQFRAASSHCLSHRRVRNPPQDFYFDPFQEIYWGWEGGSGKRGDREVLGA